MEIVDKDTKYKCDQCGKRFNWDKNSWRLGKMEYKTLTEQKEHEKTFCSDECVKKCENDN